MTYLRQLLSNFASLSVINFVNTGSSLFVIPILIANIGIEAYGKIALYQYISQIFLIIVDLGFPLYAVNVVSNKSLSRQDLSRFLYSVYYIKIVSIILILVIIIATLAFWNATAINKYMLISFSLVAITTSLYPGWLFHGLEKIQVTIIPNLASRLLIVLVLIICVQDAQDIWIVPLAYIIGNTILLMTSVRFANIYVGKLKKNTNSETLKVFKDTIEVFWSRLIIASYVSGAPLIVKASAGDFGVGIYSICEKLINASRIPFDMFSNASYPRMAREYKKSMIGKNLLALMIISALLVLASVVLLSQYRDGLNESISAIIPYMSIYIFALIPISLHSFLGTNVLLVHNYRRELTISTLFGMLYFVSSYVILESIMNDKTALIIISMVLVEVGIFSSRYYYSRSKKLI